MSGKQSSPSIWRGTLPKIGIRPTIDGRLGGVRESLEDQTMNLARRVAEMISGNLRYPNGEPVAVCDFRKLYRWRCRGNGV